jgi:hypothetical protein
MEDRFYPTHLSADRRFLEAIPGNRLGRKEDLEYNPFYKRVADHMADMHVGIFHAAVMC